jgi:hypothetical protein
MLFKDYNKSILILFAILILCSGKLLKDYLYKNNLIEGMSVISVVTTPATLRRPLPSGTAITDARIRFDVTNTSAISTGGNIYIQWDTTDTTNAFVDMSGASAANYTASATANNSAIPDLSIAIDTVNSSIASPAARISLNVTGANIPANSKITVNINNITLKPSAQITTGRNIKFIISGVLSDSIQIPVIIEPPQQQDRGVSGSSSSTNDIELAISNLNTAIGTNPSNSRDLIAAKNALINLLAQTYGTVTNAGTVFTSSGLYQAQKTALDFIGKEKARTNQNANIIETDNSNKKRMSQINQYYTQNYQANIAILKYVIYMSVALIVLTVLKTKEYIPPSISTLGTICILAFGSIEIGKKIYDILRRNDFDFDKYDWNFDQSKMDSAQLTQTDTNSLSTLGSFGAPCYGPGCCDAGTSWSDSAKKCTPGATLTGTAVWAPATSTSTSTSTLTVKITNTIDIPQNGTIRFTSPSGLFTTYGPNNPSNVSTPSLGVFTYTAPAPINANTTTTITFTGAALASPLPNADLIPRVITDVYSSSEPNRTQINIQGIPGYNS